MIVSYLQEWFVPGESDLFPIAVVLLVIGFLLGKRVPQETQGTMVVSGVLIFLVGSVVQNPKNPALWGIRNEDKVNWTYQKADGTQIPVDTGRTAGIAKGVKIIFPQTTGEFR